MKKILNIIMKGFGLLLITIVSILITLFITLKLITSNVSPTAKTLFVTTILETGQMKFLASWLLPEDEIKKIVDSNKMEDLDLEEDKDLIQIGTQDKDAIEIINIPGNSFGAKMMIVNDPSRLKLSTTYPWKEYGLELDKLVKQVDAIGGINGGLYESTLNKGGRPLGVVVADGQIQMNRPGMGGLHLIGFDEDNLLRIIDLSGYSAKKVEDLVKKERIRDAVSFQEQMDKDVNHFVKLIVNGTPRETKGTGSGGNPRTAIGQRKDGTVLLLVTDGRGKNGHLGATAADLIKIMKNQGAVNAANLDGGSSTSMYYNDKYEMTSVTLYYSNSSWKLPAAFVIEKR
jgi:exopolysaccharide biosynthesis protein